MKNHKFVQLLDLLESDERKRFKKHIKSKFPGSKLLLDILDWLYQNIDKPGFEHKGLEDMHLSIFKNKNYDAKHISNQLSKLYLELKDYLVIQSLDRQPAAKSLIFLQVLRHYDAFDLFFKEYNMLLKALEKPPYFGQTLALMHMLAYTYRYYYPATSTSENEDLMASWKYHQIFSELINLKLSIAAHNRQFLLGTDQLKTIIDTPIIQSPIEEENKFFPLMKTLRALHHLYQKKEPGCYFIAKEAYFGSYNTYTSEDQNQILRYLLNYAIDFYKNGIPQFYQEVYELYKFGVESKVLFVSNDLSSNSFINIIDISSGAGDINFAQSFFDTYLSLTNPEEQADNQLFGEALLFYAKKEYKSSIQKINQIQPGNIFLKLKSFEIKSRIYFDTKSWAELDDAIDKFKGMILRAKSQGSPALFIPFLNFIKILQLLSKIPRPTPEVLMQHFEANQPMTNNHWILDRIKL